MTAVGPAQCSVTPHADTPVGDAVPTDTRILHPGGEDRAAEHGALEHASSLTRDSRGTGLQLLRPSIAMSWRRSEIYGLDPTNRIGGSSELEFDYSSRLLRAASPVLESISNSLNGIEAGGLLADSSGTIVARFFGEADLASRADRFGGRIGAQFDESRTGTNGIATCVETREPVTILGSEHYLECFKSFDCYGLPIINPVTRRLEGAIDLMVNTGFEHRRALEVVLDRVAREISTRYFADYDPEVQQSLIAFHTLVGRTDDPVVLFGRDFVLHNRRALDELSKSDLSELEQHAMEGAHAAEARFTLESGREVAVQVASSDIGQPALLRIRSNVRERRPVPRTLGRTRSVTDRIDGRLDALAELSTPVLIIGERGTGRSRAAQRIAGEGNIVISAVDFDHRSAPESGAALVIEEADCLSARAVAVVAQMIRAGQRRIVMTAVRDANHSHNDIDYLGGLCTEWVELPPLRERPEDIAQICNVILREHRNGEMTELRLSSPVLGLLRRHRWPGNLAELATVLSEISNRRSAGDIAIADLPSRYQSLSAVRSTLTPFEHAEWDLIVRTLDACDGNKVHTAKRLGISRSKLYARLRYFQIV